MSALPIGPVQPVTFISLGRVDDAEAIEKARLLLADGQRVVFDCGWRGGGGIADLGFEVTRQRDGSFGVWIGGPRTIGHFAPESFPTLEEAARETFLTDGSLE